MSARLYDRAWLLLLTTMVLWGGNVVAGRAAIGRISPMALVCLRWVIACSVLTLLSRRQIAAEWPLLKPRLPLILVLGTIGFTVFNAMFYVASHLTSGVNLAIIQGATPVMVIIGNFLAFGVRVSRAQLAGLIMTLVGIAVVATHGSLSALFALQFRSGDLLMLMADVLYAAYTLGLRWRPPGSSMAFFTLMAYTACATSVPLLGWEIAAGMVLWPTLEGWVVLLYVALFPSVVSQLLYMRGVQLIGASRAGLFMNLLPVFGSCMAVLFLGEPFGPYHAAALALVLGGIWIAERRKAAWRDASP